MASISGPSHPATSMVASALSITQMNPCRSSQGTSTSPNSLRSMSPKVLSRVIIRSEPSGS